MRAIAVTDQADGTVGMKLVERPQPQAAISDVVVQVHASGFTSGELTWPSTWTDRLDRDRTPSNPGRELAGVVTALGYVTMGLSVGQRVFGLSDSYRCGALAECVAAGARNLARLPGDVDFTVGASVAMPGLTAWQGLFELGRFQAGQSILAHGAVGSMVTQLAGGRRQRHWRRTLCRPSEGAQEFIDLNNNALEDAGPVDLVFDFIGGDISKRPAGVIRAPGTLAAIVARPRRGLPTAERLTLSSCLIAPNWVKSSSGCTTDGCDRTSVPSRPSTRPWPLSIRPSGSAQDDHSRSSLSGGRTFLPLSLLARSELCPVASTISEGEVRAETKARMHLGSRERLWGFPKWTRLATCIFRG